MTTATTDTAALGALGLRWRPSGQASLSGSLLGLQHSLDHAFGTLLASIWGALEERHPATLAATDLEQLGYLRSFPHQATFAIPLAADEANIDEFLAGPVLDGDAAVLTRTAPATEILTPAACYHIYLAHAGEALTGPAYVTTRNTCFRRETEYHPLRRQWSFSMREIVCIGTADDTSEFLTDARAVVDRFLALIELPLQWEKATDPFFRPDTNPRHLFQKVMPTKFEATYGDGLAIASLNRHYEHFGETTNLEIAGGPAHSACAAFGLDRWMFAIVDRFGTDPAAWPDVVAAAQTVRDEKGLSA